MHQCLYYQIFLSQLCKRGAFDPCRSTGLVLSPEFVSRVGPCDVCLTQRPGFIPRHINEHPLHHYLTLLFYRLVVINCIRDIATSAQLSVFVAGRNGTTRQVPRIRETRGKSIRRAPSWPAKRRQCTFSILESRWEIREMGATKLILIGRWNTCGTRSQQP
jgi:hypothetical protein